MHSEILSNARKERFQQDPFLLEEFYELSTVLKNIKLVQGKHENVESLL
jgi:hypothetical protein